MRALRRAVLLSTLSLSAFYPAAAREIPLPDPGRSFGHEQTEMAINAYSSLPSANKTWPADRPAPTSWAETGLRDDAELVASRGYFDGGSRSFYFKDSTGRYFVFSARSPMGGDGTGKVVHRERIFHVGVPHPTEKGGVAVAIGSPADEFLISILKHAQAKMPAIPKALRSAGWAGLSDYAEPVVHDLSSVPTTRDKLGLGKMYFVQDVSTDHLRMFTTEELVAALAVEKDPLDKEKAFTVVVLLPLGARDDLVCLEGFDPSGGYFFFHASKTKGRTGREALWACFTLPYAPPAVRSLNFSINVNSLRYHRAAPAGYHFDSVLVSSASRTFR